MCTVYHLQPTMLVNQCTAIITRRACRQSAILQNIERLISMMDYVLSSKQNVAARGMLHQRSLWKLSSLRTKKHRPNISGFHANLLQVILFWL